MEFRCILILACLVLSCCQSEKPVVKKIWFSKERDIMFKIDSTTNNAYLMTQAFASDSLNYIVGLDYVFQYVNIFSVKNVNLIKKIPLIDKDSLEMKIDAMYFHNFDSIFLFHRYPSKIYLIDSSGHEKSKWEVNKPLFGRYSSYDYLIEAGMMSKQIYLNKKGNVLNSIIYFNLQSSIKVWSQPVMGKFNLITGEVDELYAHNPIEFLNLLVENRFYGTRRTYPTFFVDDEITYLSFPYEHHITVYDNEKDVIIKKCNAKSSFVSEFLETSLTYPGLESSNRYDVEEPGYVGFVFDRYRNLFYRIVKHPQDYRNDDSKLVNKYHESAWSIIVLDDELNVLGETIFPANTYDYSEVFVTPDGLLLKLLKKGNNDFNFSLFAVAHI